MPTLSSFPSSPGIAAAAPLMKQTWASCSIDRTPHPRIRTGSRIRRLTSPDPPSSSTAPASSPPILCIFVSSAASNFLAASTACDGHVPRKVCWNIW